jgi:hypothetical protein
MRVILVVAVLLSALLCTARACQMLNNETINQAMTRCAAEWGDTFVVQIPEGKYYERLVLPAGVVGIGLLPDRPGARVVVYGQEHDLSVAQNVFIEDIEWVLTARLFTSELSMAAGSRFEGNMIRCETGKVHFIFTDLEYNDDGIADRVKENLVEGAGAYISEDLVESATALEEAVVIDANSASEKDPAVAPVQEKEDETKRE